MKVGDLVKLIGCPDSHGGIVLEVCNALGIPTIDVLLNSGVIVYDRRIETYEVLDERR